MVSNNRNNNHKDKNGKNGRNGNTTWKPSVIDLCLKGNGDAKQENSKEVQL
jgi:hypothetical protein